MDFGRFCVHASPSTRLRSLRHLFGQMSIVRSQSTHSELQRSQPLERTMREQCVELVLCVEVSAGGFDFSSVVRAVLCCAVLWGFFGRTRCREENNMGMDANTETVQKKAKSQR